MTGPMRQPMRYRCTFIYGDTVKPPQRSGEVALQTEHPALPSAETEIGVGQARDDIARIVFERYHPTGIAGWSHGNEWRVEAEWVRTADGWESR